MSQCQKWVIQPIPYRYILQNLIAYTNTLSIIVPYVDTLPKTLGFPPKTKNFRQPIRIEYNYTKKTRELSARVEDSSRLSARVDSL